MGVASRVGFTSVVVSDGRAFALDRCLTEAIEHDFFFKRAIRRFGVEDFSMLVVVTVVLHAEEGIESRLKFLEEL